MTDRVKMHLSSLKTDGCLIPGGLTGHLQPADVSWNKPFESAYRELYNEWMASGEKSYTPAGNLRAPDKLLCLQWVKQAWNKVTSEVIIKSFQVCGISVDVDGSEDHLIHCIKPGQLAEAQTISAETARMVSPLVDIDDPFLDCDDCDELEEDETVIEMIKYCDCRIAIDSFFSHHPFILLFCTFNSTKVGGC